MILKGEQSRIKSNEYSGILQDTGLPHLQKHECSFEAHFCSPTLCWCWRLWWFCFRSPCWTVSKLQDWTVNRVSMALGRYDQGRRWLANQKKGAILGNESDSGTDWSWSCSSFLRVRSNNNPIGLTAPADTECTDCYWHVLLVRYHPEIVYI